MEEPQKPSEEDCCNSGCNPCVFDIYEKQLNLYENYLKNGKLDKKCLKNIISQSTYTPFIVVANKAMNDTHTIIALKKDLLSDNSSNCRLWWNPGDHFLVKCTAHNTACTRAYTPLRSKQIATDMYDFCIVVKKYNNGLVSSYLFNLKVGDLTLWRGPYGKYELVPNKYDRIIMLAQGTGIAPFISIINHILENEDDMTKICLIYCTENIETIYLRDELYSYKSFWNFTYEIFLSGFSEQCCMKYGEPIKFTRFNYNHWLEYKPFSTSDQYLLCGSQNFMDTYEKYLLDGTVDPDNVIKF